MSIDQPIDFSKPESTDTLAIYLSIPEWKMAGAH